VGKAERQVCAEEGYTGLQESHWSQANECSYAEEVVGIDEGAVGPAEGQGVGQSNLCASALLYRRKNMASGTKWKSRLTPFTRGLQVPKEKDGNAHEFKQDCSSRLL
jgi:hypothetical protein